MFDAFGGLKTKSYSEEMPEVWRFRLMQKFPNQKRGPQTKSTSKSFPRRLTFQQKVEIFLQSV